MSIRTYFENIADAIKTKGGTSNALTPAEMPQAILNLPSGSSTADGVTYDNTASELTANNVQDAIDELAEDVSTINSDLSELNSKTITANPISNLRSGWDANGGYLKVGRLVTVNCTLSTINSEPAGSITIGTLPAPVVAIPGQSTQQQVTGATTTYSIDSSGNIIYVNLAAGRARFNITVSYISHV